MYSRQAPRRRHPTELKDRVLAACEEPGASVAAVAQAHGLNANLVHKWRRCQDGGRSLRPTPVVAATAVRAQQPVATRTLPDTASAFVALQLQMPSSVPPADIRLELRRGAATVIVSWPIQEAAACGSWLREWLR